MTLHELYLVVEKEYNNATEQLYEYTKLARSLGLKDEYKKDVVYLKLKNNLDKYEFTKNIIMNHMI